MTRFLVATDSVHTTAAACDYLGDRLADGDVVVALVVVGADTDVRDAGDALNVATVRLPAADVRTERREGDAATEILAAADDHDADEVVVGVRSDDVDADAGLGSTAANVLASADRPVVVVPA